jgi:hypothetical protein
MRRSGSAGVAAFVETACRVRLTDAKPVGCGAVNYSVTGGSWCSGQGDVRRPDAHPSPSAETNTVKTSLTSGVSASGRTRARLRAL